MIMRSQLGKYSKMTTEIRVPTLGESIAEATVGNWSKAVGEIVEVDEILCELETDKVTIEVPSPVQGTLQEIVVEEGETVSVDALLAVVSAGETDNVSAGLEKVKTKAPPTQTQTEPAKTVDKAPARDPEDAPSARKMMADQNIPTDTVEVSGRDGRRMKEDVQKVVAMKSKATVKPLVTMDTQKEERIRMSRLRQTIARRLKDAQNTAAILTTYNEADMSGVMKLRSTYKDEFLKKHRVKLGFMSFFVRACCTALIEVPEVNAEMDGTDIIYRNFVNMGIAVGIPTGLVVPVLRNVQSMSFADIESEIVKLGTRAREGKLAIEDMQGGTFSISNGGVYGSLMSSPILNPPQSGILGMHKIQDRPVVVDGQIVIRPMMYLALSYDHRIVDGQGAVTFLVRVKEAIEDPQRLLLDI